LRDFCLDGRDGLDFVEVLDLVYLEVL